MPYWYSILPAGNHRCLSRPPWLWKKAPFKEHKCTSIILLREIWGQEGFCWRCWPLGPSLSELPLLQLMGFTPGSALSCASHPRCAALFRAKQGFCNTSASSPTQPLAEDHLQVTKALQGTWTSPGASSRWMHITFLSQTCQDVFSPSYTINKLNKEV